MFYIVRGRGQDWWKKKPEKSVVKKKGRTGAKGMHS